MIDQDILFLAAILIYFERESAQQRALPKEAVRVLKRFAASPGAEQVPTAQWTMLKSATQECLAYVGARKR